MPKGERKPTFRRTGPAPAIEEGLPEEGWTKSQWRQFLLAFTLLFTLANGAFWYSLVRAESATRRYQELLIRFDQEWAYLQRLARLQRIEAHIAAAGATAEAVFRGEVTGMSFAYPSAWGEYVESEATTSYVSVRFRRGSMARIAGAFAGETDPSLITGWDSVAASVRVPEDVDRVCATQTHADTCLTFTSPTGLRYARVRYENFITSEGALKDVVFYVFTHPEGDFPGIALGNPELRSIGVPHTVSDMDAIMDSVVLER